MKKSEEHKALILKALQAHFLFENLAPSSLRDLVDVMKPRSHAPGEDVIKQGETRKEGRGRGWQEGMSRGRGKNCFSFGLATCDVEFDG